MPATLHTSHIKSLPLLHSGKVRDIYDIDDQHMLIVTTDRISAFDVIMPTPVPGKGIILNQVTQFWMNKLSHIIPNQLCDLKLEDVLPDEAERAEVAEHAMIVKKLKALPVRGYRARLYYWLRLERLPGDRHDLRHRTACRPATGR